MSSTPFLVRFGGIVGAATVAALLASLPGALRLTQADVGVLTGWISLAGLLVMPMIMVVPVLRQAGQRLRGFLPPDGAGALARTTAVAVFLCTWVWLLSTLGAVLRAKTHHRALGAVTFAILATLSMVFLAMVAFRLMRILAALRARSPGLGIAVAGLLLVLALALVGVRVVHAAPALSFETRATLVDGLAIALAATFGARRLMLPRLGPPAAVCIVIVSLHTLSTAPHLLPALERVCTVYVTLLRLFAGP
jgi:hypothetical protein